MARRWDNDTAEHRIHALCRMIWVGGLLTPVVLGQGGLAPGGFNFDAKVRRESVDTEDLFIAHIGGMDAYARALVDLDGAEGEGPAEQLGIVGAPALLVAGHVHGPRVLLAQGLEQVQAIVAQGIVVGIDHDTVEERIHRLLQYRHGGERSAVIILRQVGLHLGGNGVQCTG